MAKSQFGKKYDEAQVVLAAADKKVKAAETALLAAKQAREAFYAAHGDSPRC